MRKPSKVVFASDELEQAFNELSDEDAIKKGIRKAVADLKENAFCGTQIPKRLFPKEYIRKYGVTNLWKYDLPQGWRLIYTVTALNEVQLLSAVLDWFSHKDYEKQFNY